VEASNKRLLHALQNSLLKANTDRRTNKNQNLETNP